MFDKDYFKNRFFARPRTFLYSVVFLHCESVSGNASRINWEQCCCTVLCQKLFCRLIILSELKEALGDQLPENGSFDRKKKKKNQRENNSFNRNICLQSSSKNSFIQETNKLDLIIIQVIASKEVVFLWKNVIKWDEKGHVNWHVTIKSPFLAYSIVLQSCQKKKKR